jgi:hypothetical protein
MVGITRCRPLPAPGGPSTTVESRTPAQHGTPRLRPSLNPTSRGPGCETEGRNTAARATSVLGPAAVFTW